MTYIWKIAFSHVTWRKVRAERIFVNDSNFASWLLDLELRQRQASVHSTQSIIFSTRTSSSRALFSTGRAIVLAMTWVWFLNLHGGEAVEAKLENQNI